MPLTEFLRLLAIESGVSIVASSELDTQLVTIDIVEQPISQILTVVARRANVELTETNGVYFLGQLKREDRGVLVRRVLRLDAEGLDTTVKTLLSQVGQVKSFSDGLLVVSDRVEILERVGRMLDDIEGVESACWCVQLYLISLSASDLHDFGFDATPAVEVAATFATSSGSLAGIDGSGARLAASLAAVLQASAGSDTVSLVAQPLFFLSDGAKSNFTRGEKVPVVRRAVSDQGTVTDTGFDIVQTGLVVDVAFREVAIGSGRLNVQVSLSSILGFEGQYPRIASEDFQTEGVVSSGGVYLLGSVERSAQSTGERAGLFLGSKASDEKNVVQIWARVVRVGSPIK